MSGLRFAELDGIDLLVDEDKPLAHVYAGIVDEMIGPHFFGGIGGNS